MKRNVRVGWYACRDGSAAQVVETGRRGDWSVLAERWAYCGGGAWTLVCHVCYLADGTQSHAGEGPHDLVRRLRGQPKRRGPVTGVRRPYRSSRGKRRTLGILSVAACDDMLRRIDRALAL